MTADNAASVKRPEVVLELDAPTGWLRLGSVCDAEPLGSITSDGQKREVYVFGWMDGSPGVWRSVAGVDVETESVRGMVTFGFERIADFTDINPVELIIRRAGTNATRLVRFRLEVAP